MPSTCSSVRDAWSGSTRSPRAADAGDVEDAGGVLGPLDVAADPEQRLGDPAQHRRASAAAAAAVAVAAAAAVAAAGRGAWVGRSPAVGVRRPARRGARRRRARGRPRDVARRQHPGVLGAAALAGVDDQLALGQRDPGQAAGQHPDVVAVVDRERAQVDVPRRAAGRRSASARWTAARPAARSSRAGRRARCSRSVVELRSRRPAGRSRCPCRPSRRPA